MKLISQVTHVSDQGISFVETISHSRRVTAVSRVSAFASDNFKLIKTDVTFWSTIWHFNSTCSVYFGLSHHGKGKALIWICICTSLSFYSFSDWFMQKSNTNPDQISTLPICYLTGSLQTPILVNVRHTGLHLHCLLEAGAMYHPEKVNVREIMPSSCWKRPIFLSFSPSAAICSVRLRQLCCYAASSQHNNWR